MNLRSLTVIEIGISYQLSLRLDTEARVVLGCPFKLTQVVDDGRQDVILDPGRQDVMAAIGLFGAKVLSAVAFTTGSMRLVFDNGWHLNSRANQGPTHVFNRGRRARRTTRGAARTHMVDRIKV
jgi:hypothetical protein